MCHELSSEFRFGQPMAELNAQYCCDLSGCQAFEVFGDRALCASHKWTCQFVKPSDQRSGQLAAVM